MIYCMQHKIDSPDALAAIKYCYDNVLAPENEKCKQNECHIAYMRSLIKKNSAEHTFITKFMRSRDVDIVELYDNDYKTNYAEKQF